jgi:hypothetical protein
MRFLLPFLSALLLSTAVAAEKTTAAPPELQEQMFRILGYQSSPDCARPSKPTVVSSKLSTDARFESDVLVAGEVVEVWQIRRCRERIRYLFRLGPSSKGSLSIVGFERVR